MQLSFHNPTTTGRDFMKFLTDFIWYLDPHWSKLKVVGFKPPEFLKLIYSITTTEEFTPFNDYLRRHQSSPQVSQDQLRNFAAIGYYTV